MYYLSVTRWFCAAHWLPDHPGKCKNLHGHNWKVIVTIKQRHLEDNGMIIDFKEFKAIIDDILPDHKCLNDYIPDIVPTAENLARYIFEEVDRAFSKAGLYPELQDVEIWEGRDSCAIYTSQ